MPCVDANTSLINDDEVQSAKKEMSFGNNSGSEAANWVSMEIFDLVKLWGKIGSFCIVSIVWSLANKDASNALANKEAADPTIEDSVWLLEIKEVGSIAEIVSAGSLISMTPDCWLMLFDWETICDDSFDI